MAVGLARDRWRILIADIKEDEAAQTLTMVEEAGGTGRTIHCDVTKVDDVERMAEFCFKEWGGADLLVNNAGVVPVGTVGDVPLEHWQWIVNVNFWGVVYGCHVFVPRMKRQGGGYIINVASAAGLLSLPEMATYNVTKAAIISLSETLKSELAPHNIGVTVSCPTFFKTNLLESHRYTDAFSRDRVRAAFENAKLTSRDVAEATIRAMRKKKLYVIPQPMGRILFVIKRTFPSVFYGVLAWLNKRGYFRKLFYTLSKGGMT